MAVIQILFLLLAVIAGVVALAFRSALGILVILLAACSFFLPSVLLLPSAGWSAGLSLALSAGALWLGVWAVAEARTQRAIRALDDQPAAPPAPRGYLGAAPRTPRGYLGPEHTGWAVVMLVGCTAVVLGFLGPVIITRGGGSASGIDVVIGGMKLLAQMVEFLRDLGDAARYLGGAKGEVIEALLVLIFTVSVLMDMFLGCVWAIGKYLITRRASYRAVLVPVASILVLPLYLGFRIAMAPHHDLPLVWALLSTVRMAADARIVGAGFGLPVIGVGILLATIATMVMFRIERRVLGTTRWEIEAAGSTATAARVMSDFESQATDEQATPEEPAIRTAQPAKEEAPTDAEDSAATATESTGQGVAPAEEPDTVEPPADGLKDVGAAPGAESAVAATVTEKKKKPWIILGAVSAIALVSLIVLVSLPSGRAGPSESDLKEFAAVVEAYPAGTRKTAALGRFLTKAKEDSAFRIYGDDVLGTLEAFLQVPSARWSEIVVKGLAGVYEQLGCHGGPMQVVLVAPAERGAALARACPPKGPRLLSPDRMTGVKLPYVATALAMEYQARQAGLQNNPVHRYLVDLLLRSDAPGGRGGSRSLGVALQAGRQGVARAPTGSLTPSQLAQRPQANEPMNAALEAGVASEQGTIDQDCEPKCHGRTCGSDGCGGTCGECTEGATCSEQGVCQAALAKAGPPPMLPSIPWRSELEGLIARVKGNGSAESPWDVSFSDAKRRLSAPNINPPLYDDALPGVWHFEVHLNSNRTASAPHIAVEIQDERVAAFRLMYDKKVSGAKDLASTLRASYGAPDDHWPMSYAGVRFDCESWTRGERYGVASCVHTRGRNKRYQAALFDPVAHRRLSSAREACVRAIPYYKRGRAAVDSKTRAYRAAISAFDQAIEEVPTFERARMWKAFALLQQHDTVGATRVANAVLSRSKSYDVKAYANWVLSRVALYQGNSYQAQQAADRAAALDPWNGYHASYAKALRDARPLKTVIIRAGAFIVDESRRYGRVDEDKAVRLAGVPGIAVYEQFYATYDDGSLNDRITKLADGMQRRRSRY